MITDVSQPFQQPHQANGGRSRNPFRPLPAHRTEGMMAASQRKAERGHGQEQRHRYQVRDGNENHNFHQPLSRVDPTGQDRNVLDTSPSDLSQPVPPGHLSPPRQLRQIELQIIADSDQGQTGRSEQFSFKMKMDKTGKMGTFQRGKNSTNTLADPVHKVQESEETQEKMRIKPYGGGSRSRDGTESLHGDILRDSEKAQELAPRQGSASALPIVIVDVNKESLEKILNDKILEKNHEQLLQEGSPTQAKKLKQKPRKAANKQLRMNAGSQEWRNLQGSSNHFDMAQLKWPRAARKAHPGSSQQAGPPHHSYNSQPSRRMAGSELTRSVIRSGAAVLSGEAGNQKTNKTRNQQYEGSQQQAKETLHSLITLNNDRQAGCAQGDLQNQLLYPLNSTKSDDSVEVAAGMRLGVGFATQDKRQDKARRMMDRMVEAQALRSPRFNNQYYKNMKYHKHMAQLKRLDRSLARNEVSFRALEEPSQGGPDVRQVQEHRQQRQVGASHHLHPGRLTSTNVNESGSVVIEQSVSSKQTRSTMKKQALHSGGVVTDDHVSMADSAGFANCALKMQQQASKTKTFSSSVCDPKSGQTASQHVFLPTIANTTQNNSIGNKEEISIRNTNQSPVADSSSSLLLNPGRKLRDQHPNKETQLKGHFALLNHQHRHVDVDALNEWVKKRQGQAGDSALASEASIHLLGKLPQRALKGSLINNSLAARKRKSRTGAAAGPSQEDQRRAKAGSQIERTRQSLNSECSSAAMQKTSFKYMSVKGSPVPSSINMNARRTLSNEMPNPKNIQAPLAQAVASRTADVAAQDQQLFTEQDEEKGWKDSQHEQEHPSTTLHQNLYQAHDQHQLTSRHPTDELEDGPISNIDVHQLINSDADQVQVKMPTSGLLPSVHHPNESVEPSGPDIMNILEANDENAGKPAPAEHLSSFNKPIKLLKLVKHASKKPSSPLCAEEEQRRDLPVKNVPNLPSLPQRKSRLSRLGQLMKDHKHLKSQSCTSNANQTGRREYRSRKDCINSSTSSNVELNFDAQHLNLDGSVARVHSDLKLNLSQCTRSEDPQGHNVDRARASSTMLDKNAASQLSIQLEFGVAQLSFREKDSQERRGCSEKFQQRQFHLNQNQLIKYCMKQNFNGEREMLRQKQKRKALERYRRRIQAGLMAKAEKDCGQNGRSGSVVDLGAQVTDYDEQRRVVAGSPSGQAGGNHLRRRVQESLAKLPHVTHGKSRRQANLSHHQRLPLLNQASPLNLASPNLPQNEYCGQTLPRSDGNSEPDSLHSRQRTTEQMHLQLLIDDLHQIAENTPQKCSPGHQGTRDAGQAAGDFQLGINARKKQLKDEKRLLAKQNLRFTPSPILNTAAVRQPNGRKLHEHNLDLNHLNPSLVSSKHVSGSQSAMFGAPAHGNFSPGLLAEGEVELGEKSINDSGGLERPRPDQNRAFMPKQRQEMKIESGEQSHPSYSPDLRGASVYVSDGESSQGEYSERDNTQSQDGQTAGEAHHQEVVPRQQRPMAREDLQLPSSYLQSSLASAASLDEHASLHESNVLDGQQTMSELGHTSKIGSKTGEDDRSRCNFEQGQTYTASKHESRQDHSSSKQGQTKWRGQAAAFGHRDDLQPFPNNRDRAGSNLNIRIVDDVENAQQAALAEREFQESMLAAPEQDGIQQVQQYVMLAAPQHRASGARAVHVAAAFESNRSSTQQSPQSSVKLEQRLPSALQEDAQTQQEQEQPPEVSVQPRDPVPGAVQAEGEQIEPDQARMGHDSVEVKIEIEDEAELHQEEQELSASRRPPIPEDFATFGDAFDERDHSGERLRTSIDDRKTPLIQWDLDNQSSTRQLNQSSIFASNGERTHVETQETEHSKRRTASLHDGSQDEDSKKSSPVLEPVGDPSLASIAASAAEEDEALQARKTAMPKAKEKMEPTDSQYISQQDVTANPADPKRRKYRAMRLTKLMEMTPIKPTKMSGRSITTDRGLPSAAETQDRAFSYKRFLPLRQYGQFSK